MSVLLDALKNAALEKQRRDQASSGEDHTQPLPENNSPTLDLPVVNTHKKDDDTPAADDAIDAHVNTDFDEMDINIDFDELNLDFNEETFSANEQEVSTDSNTASTIATDTPAVEAATEGAENADKDTHQETVTESTVRDTHRETATESTERDTHQETVTESTGRDTHRETATESAERGTHLATEPTATEKAEAQATGTEPETKVEATPSVNSSPEQQKNSFQTLLQTNKRITRKRRIHFIVTFLILILITGGLTAGYYTYVVSQSKNLSVYQPPSTENTTTTAAASVPQDQIDEAMSEKSVDSSPVSDDLSNDTTTSPPPTQQPVARHKTSTAPTSPRVDLPRSKKKAVPVKPVKNALTTAARPSSIQPSRQPELPTIDTLIHRAFTAYRAGDLAKAEADYALASQRDPYNRDVILGRAAVAMQRGKYTEAMSLYQQQLARNPRDVYAHSGILSLASIDTVSPALLSRTNQLLLDHPEASYLHFLKGSLLAAQQQWAAAQASFFNAWTRDADRIEYAYNLAIALDHLGEHGEALRFYRRVIRQENTSADGARMNIHSVKQRIKELETQSE